jgi:hypothetical protein
VKKTENGSGSKNFAKLVPAGDSARQCLFFKEPWPLSIIPPF